MFETSLRELIEEYKENPVDLLGIGDEAAEYEYLVNASLSYQRTINDVSAVSGNLLRDGGIAVKVLEIGAYLGVVSLYLARSGFDVAALDIPEFMQNACLRKRYEDAGVECLAANLGDYVIPAEDNSYDLVIMCETLEHLNFNPVPVMLEVNRVLKTGGKLYLSLPNLASLVNRAKLLLGRSIHNPVDDFFQQLGDDSNMLVGVHWREYAGNELVELVRRTGFHVDQHYYFTTHRPSLPAKLIYRLLPTTRPNHTVFATKTESMVGRYEYRRLMQYSKVG